MYPACWENYEFVVDQRNPLGLIRYVLREGDGGITYYHSILKEFIQLQTGVFYLFNIMFELWTSSAMMFVWTLVWKGSSEFGVAKVEGIANVAAT